MRRTPIYDYHTANAKIVEFAGYDMPVWYTSITEEHLAVRNASGIFDVSHMGRVVISGNGATAFVDSLVPTRSATQPVGKSFYTLLLNYGGGVIDDLIVIKRGDEDYLLVVNAANRTKDLEHIIGLSGGVNVEDITEKTTMIAVQGPDALHALQPLTSARLEEIKRHTHIRSRVGDSDATITRTGYTGEDGYEVILYDSGVENNTAALSAWTDLTKRAKPCGLGARDSLRIEAGLPLYGHEIDENTNPFEAELSWVVTKEKTGYVGYDAVAKAAEKKPERVRKGVVLDEKIPRQGFQVTDGAGAPIGRVTSGTFSPVLKKGVALAYLDERYAQTGTKIKVTVRDVSTDGTVVKPPFYDETAYGWKRASTKRI